MTVAPLLTFRQKVAPIETLCRRVIADAGGVPRRRAPGEFKRAGYVFPEPVAPESQGDYALKILALLTRAHAMTTRDSDEAMKAAWDAAVLLAAAADKFPRLRQVTAASQAAAAKRTPTRARAWRDEVESRRPGMTKGAKMAQIADRDRVNVGTVKKAIQRLTARM